MIVHEPVMVRQVLEVLDIRPGDTVLDCTLGEGGHTAHFLEKASCGIVIGIEQDEEVLARAKERFREQEDRFIPVQGNFSSLQKIVANHTGSQVDRIFFDLGISMYHFKESGRGFSFSKNEPLDMRLDRSRAMSAADVVNGFDEKKLAEIVWAYGEERFSNQIAAAIVRRRKLKQITMSKELADIVMEAVPKRFWPKSIHPATKTFQAVRIFVNDEIEILEKALRDGIDTLKEGGRMCVISFHSLEDRIVKSLFRELAKGCTCPPDFPVCVCGKRKVVKVLTKKPLIAQQEEVGVNPASRSARLRCALKLTNDAAFLASMKVTA
ncbi:MAG: 16S rRNA (cytosine(1402)-N(4))-methyltransferase RsmH [Spirochaetes bacterium]|nr:16S rRNA (cytosine(1402)-N(4))-methyltransferase RsmH [Spirochaetota bacterium]